MCIFLCMLSTCWQKWLYLLILDQVLGFAQCQSQLVKNLPAIRETWVQSLSWKIPWRRERLPTPVFWPGKGKGYPLQYSGLESSMDCIVPGVIKNQTQLSNFDFTSFQQIELTSSFLFQPAALIKSTIQLPITLTLRTQLQS